MAEINEVIEKLKRDATLQRQLVKNRDPKVALSTTDALALLTELETVRAQRDEYKEALESIRDAVSAIDTYDIDDDTMLVFIATVDEDTRTALNTQPQAEWTPRKHQKLSPPIEIKLTKGDPRLTMFDSEESDE